MCKNGHFALCEVPFVVIKKQLVCRPIDVVVSSFANRWVQVKIVKSACESANIRSYKDFAIYNFCSGVSCQCKLYLYLCNAVYSCLCIARSLAANTFRHVVKNNLKCPNAYAIIAIFFDSASKRPTQCRKTNARQKSDFQFFVNAKQVGNFKWKVQRNFKKQVN